MTIENLQTFLVYPNKGVAEPRLISGTDVPLEGEVFTLLSEIYLKSERECSIDIAFNQPTEGVGLNPCRALLLDYARAPSVATGLPLATRLAAYSTKRSGLGLLFLATGVVGAQRKIVIARFAANSGILADENREALSVEFVERVFLRSVGSYKAVLYQDTVTDHGFWMAKAVDRQINSSETEVSRYWIADFLDSDFKTTSATGTRVLAVAMRNAAKATDNLDIKKEITAAATLGAGLNDQVMTANEFIARLGLSQRSREAITAQMRHQGLLNEQFRFSAEEFNRQLPYKSVELHSGAILTAAATEFDQVFAHTEPTADGQVTYTATGRVISEKLEKVQR
ncbi:hypothetical protein GGE07_006078 [Sinorhizobium terangae]|uniref:Nucleoid-associated protein n=1 Tax=Sinorhizobium terangae TaxID=110322 RepID=A0A6N7LD28_SINTE|nr:hypothetical protein [Sinorhizobium terangae]MBB4189396.1 hypothetical protein [Sinorhizobium terangae]MQX15771.1 hypothetical protein [Sinorhizobium terangae]